MHNPNLPPTYVNVPAPVVYAHDVNDRIVLTMIRILGLCWNRGKTPPLTPTELAEALGRSLSTLYRHLRILKDDDEGGKNAGCLGWIHVEHADRRLVIRPLVRIASRDRASRSGRAPDTAPTGEAPKGEFYQALAEVGIENPKRSQLAHLDLDPAWVYAWHYWAKHPHRQGLKNPTGNVIRKLEAKERPPREFLREARQFLEDRAWRREHLPGPLDGRRSEPQPPPEPEVMDPVPIEVHRIWAAVLGSLQSQMTRATFSARLRGSRVVEVEDHHLTVGVSDEHSVAWLTYRLMPVIRRTVARHAGHEVEIHFVKRPTANLKDEARSGETVSLR